MRLGHWLTSSAHKKLCYLSPNVLFWNKWRKKSKGNWLTQVDMETAVGMEVVR